MSILELLATRPDGMRGREIMERSGLTRHETQAALRGLAGAVVLVGRGPKNFRWALAEHEGQARARVAADTLRLRKEKKRQQNARAQLKRAADGKKTQLHGFDPVPTRRVIRSASEAPPLVKTGPASVFELGAV